MKKFLFLVLIICTSTVCSVQAIKNINNTNLHCNCETHKHKPTYIPTKDSEILTVRDCISIGIQNSPVIKEYAHRLEMAKSDVGIAKSEYFPEFGIGGYFNYELNSDKENFSKRYHELPALSVTLNKMFYDFGKTTANIKTQEFAKIAAEYEFEDSVCSTVFNIKIHYYDALLAQMNYEIKKMNLAIQKQILAMIESYVNKGERDAVDLVATKLEVEYAKSELLNAENEYKNAKEALNNAMFFENAPNYSIYETQSFLYNPQEQTIVKNTIHKLHKNAVVDDTIFQHPNYSYDEGVKIANLNSPDLKALLATKEAMKEALKATKRQYYPAIVGGVGYNFVNSTEFKNNNFNLAVGVETSVNGMRQKYEEKGAKAQLDIADTAIEYFKKNLYFKVRKCINSVNTSYKDIAISREKMKLAAKTFDMCYEGYKKNTIRQLELDDAEITYIETVENYIAAQHKYNIDLINLEMALHEHLIDYHDDAEHAVKFHEGKESESLGKLIKCNKKHKP